MRKTQNNHGGEVAEARGLTGGPWLSRADAAARLGVSIRTLERLAIEGDSPKMVRIGRKVLYSEVELDRWMSARQFASTSARAA